MTVTGRVKFAAALFALITYTGGVFAQEMMPQGQFVCQIEDADGLTRILGVQADTLLEARNTLQGKTKWKVPAGQVVIECIDPRTQTFKSRDAQKAYMEELR